MNGAFLTCMEMSASGLLIIGMAIIQVGLVTDPVGPARARLPVRGGSWGRWWVCWHYPRFPQHLWFLLVYIDSSPDMAFDIFVGFRVSPKEVIIPPMNLHTRLSRSNGYRLLGMYDESILILEDIPPGKERWDSLVVEARYNTYRDAEVWELANAMSGLMCRRRPNSLKWRFNYVDGMIKLGEIDDAIEALEEVKDRFASIAGFIFRLAKCQAILGNVEEAKKLVKQAIEKDAKYKMEFAEDSAFDGVWDSF